jgi:hypothetical protein
MIAAAVGTICLAAAPAQNKNKLPRTAWGKPDLEGTWDFRTITPLERPDKFKGREFLTPAEAGELEKETVDLEEFQDNRPAAVPPAGGNVDRRADGTPGFYNSFWLDGGTKPDASLRTSLITDPPDGKLPPQTEGAKQRAAARRAHQKDQPADSWLDLPASLRCLVGFNAGPPLTPGGYNQNLEIAQTRDTVALMTEMVHATRVVPLDGRPQPGGQILQWSGVSRGHWDGDTLVIETSQFREDRGWMGSSQNMKLVERITLVDAGKLTYTYTVNDPDTWTRPWTASMTLRRAEAPLYEYACHEGNYSLPNVLSGQRALERKSASATKP